MNVPSVLKCKYCGSSPAQRAVTKPTRKDHNRLNYFAYQQQWTLTTDSTLSWHKNQTDLLCTERNYSVHAVIHLNHGIAIDGWYCQPMVVIGVSTWTNFFLPPITSKAPVDPSKEFCKPGVPYRCFNTHCVALTIVSLSRIFLHCNVNMIIKMCHTTITCHAYNKLIYLSKSISVTPPATVQMDPPILEFVSWSLLESAASFTVTVFIIFIVIDPTTLIA